MIRVSLTRFVYTDLSAPTLVIRMSSFLLALGEGVTVTGQYNLCEERRMMGERGKPE